MPTDAATCGGVDNGCSGDPLSTTGITCDACHNTAGPDLEHVPLVAGPGRYTSVSQPGPAMNGHANEIVEEGPDNGPEDRVYAGIDEGLVLLRNELQVYFLPGQAIGRNDAAGNPIVAQNPHLEETLSANLNNTVDNYQSLPPLQPSIFRYNIALPTARELAEPGVTLKAPPHVHAQVDYEHFPPMTPRWLARATSGEVPAGHTMNLLNEQTLDTFLENIQDIASDDFTVHFFRFVAGGIRDLT